MGTLLVNLHNYKDAEPELAEAIRLDPDNDEAHRLLLLLRRTAAEQDRALIRVRPLITGVPDTAFMVASWRARSPNAGTRCFATPSPRSWPARAARRWPIN